MSGGLIQLVAYGAQDLFLTNDPQITFFKIVYRRHTNFSTEVIPQYFVQNPNFGKRMTCIISRNGDLIRKMHLVAILPRIPSFKDEFGNLDVISKFAWVKRIGYALIKYIEIEIGGELIDRLYGEWLNIWHELTIRNQKDLSKMLGDVQELTDFTNGKRSYKLFIPLYFWFNRHAGLALPVVSLQYNSIKINLEINDFNKCYIIAPTHYINVDNDLVNFEQYEYLKQTVNGVTSLGRFIYFDILDRRLYFQRISNNTFQSIVETNPDKIGTEQKQDDILFKRKADGSLVNAQYLIIGQTTKFAAMPRINAVEKVHRNRTVNFKNIDLGDTFLLVEYVFLDDEERVRFAQAKHEYLIEQVFYNDEKTIDGLNQSFKVGFTQVCKELVWIAQLSVTQNTRLNDVFNYTNSLMGEKNADSIIKQETLILNGKERISLRDSEYFTNEQVYQNHTHSPIEGIHTYSFGIHPEKHQPSGAANLSKIDSIFLRLIASPNISFYNTAKLRIYGIFYNILRIANGLSGLVFSIDNQ
jgi:hypothetical protein